MVHHCKLTFLEAGHIPSSELTNPCEVLMETAGVQILGLHNSFGALCKRCSALLSGSPFVLGMSIPMLQGSSLVAKQYGPGTEAAPSTLHGRKELSTASWNATGLQYGAGGKGLAGCSHRLATHCPIMKLVSCQTPPSLALSQVDPSCCANTGSTPDPRTTQRGGTSN